jgi:nuclear pore complex protein Nup155
MVEWCLVVTTAEEAILCALARTSSDPNSKRLKLIPTRFCIPTDWVAFLSVGSTQDGRIFLGGQDGNLYEMDYDGLLAHENAQQQQQQQQLEQSASTTTTSSTTQRQLEEFYDGTTAVPFVLTEGPPMTATSVLTSNLLYKGKRVLSTFLPSLSERPHKCRKLNHSQSGIANAIFPEILQSAASAVFGGSGTTTGGGPIVQIVMDDERHVLYTLSSRGWICAIDVTQQPPQQGGVRLAAVMDTAKTARLYLEAVSRGRMYPPGSSGRSEGIITFPGGGTSAQAGVGGMDGARTILKVADASTSRSNHNHRRHQQQAPNILTPVSIHVVPRRESARLTLVAVTSGGLRYYISCLSPHVLSSGPSQPYFGTSRRLDPFQPHSKLTFCHVRAPPPLMGMNNAATTTTTTTTGTTGGMVPQLASTLDQLSRVDASWYRLGVFVVALKKDSKHNNNNNNNNGGAVIGNMILTASADSVARLETTKPTDNGGLATLNNTNTNTNNNTAIEKYVAPGGIAEVLSMPMSSAYGSSSPIGGGDDFPFLPGGRVWDISDTNASESTLLQLALNSKTPTDSELGVGMVPAYYPKSKVRLPKSSSSGGTPNSSGDRQMERMGTVPSRSTSSVALTVFTNILLSRPIRHGITVQTPSLKSSSSTGAAAPGGGAGQITYRISKRTGCQGFSLTAGEEKSSTSTTRSTSSMSARLSPWLLRPAVVPLNPLAVQHLIPTNNHMIALNAGGLHYFGVQSAMRSLATALMTAGVNVKTDDSVTNFFTSYGYKEGCAMCLMLAIGCGPSDDNQVKDRATRAALQRAFVPKLVLVPDDAPRTSSPQDPLIPHGYEYKPSALCESVGVVLARLLRPVWHKPAVVVTEGRVIKRKGASKTRTTPVKVELLLDDATLEEIRKPLYALQALMKDVFSPAIKTIPGVGSQVDDNMDVENENGQEHFLTRALEYQMHSRAGSGGSHHLRPSEAEEIARLTEERIIHSYYRLLSRSVQLLSLLSHLRRAQSMSELPEVEWGLLHGISIAQLVQTRDGQERLEGLLNSLITSDTKSATPSADANQLANLFAGQCYHFFSPGSRFAYLGFRSANDAFACPPNSSRRAVRVKEAVVYLKQAARHWFSPPLITGRILRTREKEGYTDIAERASRFDSPLAKAVTLLIQLGEVSGVVDICLLTASNFTGKKISVSDSSELMFREHVSDNILPWEQGLYHKRRDPSEANVSGGNSGSSSNSNSLALGTTVTGKDAIDTCYALVFSTLSKLLNSADFHVGESMVSVCAAASDKDFLQAFFAHLLESNHKDTLLRIDSPELEKWLATQKSEPDLLWKYYVVQRKHVQAGEVAWNRATDATADLHLNDRIECLVRALDSYSSALNSSQQNDTNVWQWNTPGKAPANVDRDELQRSVTQAKETLDVARLQSRVLHTIQSPKYDIPEEDVKKLNYTLVAVSDLYNEYAHPMNMYENCLLVLYTCRHDDTNHIQMLWKSIFCEEVLPCSTRSEQVYRFLQSLPEDSMYTNSDITLLPENATAKDSKPLFESGLWMQKLEGRIISLGKEVYGKGADYVFPVDFVAVCLEGKSSIFP